MSDPQDRKRVSQLPEAHQVHDDDLLIIVQSGVTRRIKAGNLLLSTAEQRRQFVKQLGSSDSLLIPYSEIGFDNPAMVEIQTPEGELVSVVYRIDSAGVQISSNVSLNLHTVIIRS